MKLMKRIWRPVRILQAENPISRTELFSQNWRHYRPNLKKMKHLRTYKMLVAHPTSQTRHQLRNLGQVSILALDILILTWFGRLDIDKGRCQQDNRLLSIVNTLLPALCVNVILHPNDYFSCIIRTSIYVPLVRCQSSIESPWITTTPATTNTLKYHFNL